VKKIFSIYDEKAGAYLQPFFLDTVGQAERALLDCLADSNHNFSRHTADFTLFLLGEFDEQTGLVTMSKMSLCNLVELKPTDNLVEFPESKKIGGTN
jgi:hypothetical protein